MITTSLSKFLKTNQNKDVHQANENSVSKEMKVVGILSAEYWLWKAPQRHFSSLYLTSQSCSATSLFPDDH